MNLKTVETQNFLIPCLNKGSLPKLPQLLVTIASHNKLTSSSEGTFYSNYAFARNVMKYVVYWNTECISRQLSHVHLACHSFCNKHHFYLSLFCIEYPLARWIIVAVMFRKAYKVTKINERNNRSACYWFVSIVLTLLMYTLTLLHISLTFFGKFTNKIRKRFYINGKFDITDNRLISVFELLNKWNYICCNWSQYIELFTKIVSKCFMSSKYRIVEAKFLEEVSRIQHLFTYSGF
jgi:hypothetical protein